MWLFFGHYFVGNNRRNFPFQWLVIASLLRPLILLASTLLVTSTWEAVKFVMLFLHLKAHRALAPMKILERFHGEHFNKYFAHLCHVFNIKISKSNLVMVYVISQFLATSTWKSGGTLFILFVLICWIPLSWEISRISKCQFWSRIWVSLYSICTSYTHWCFLCSKKHGMMLS